LTATTGLVLLVLLPIEGLTLLSLHSFLSVHMLAGVALIPPVALKLGSTFYRFFRYYTGSAIFREKGPPQLAMRIFVAPALVVSTVGLFGSGVALMLLEHPNSLVFAVHKGSFIIWLGAIGIHVLVYLWHLPRLAIADWVRGKQEAVGRRLRRQAVAASLLAGGGVALVALPVVAPGTGSDSYFPRETVRCAAEHARERVERSVAAGGSRAGGCRSERRVDRSSPDERRLRRGPELAAPPTAAVPASASATG
jgi:hypothetical protein